MIPMFCFPASLPYSRIESHLYLYIGALDAGLYAFFRILYKYFLEYNAARPIFTNGLTH